MDTMADAARATSGRRSVRLAGRCRSGASWTSPCTARTASTRRGAGRPARRLPHVARGRAAVRRRRRPLPRRRVGPARPSRRVHRRRRRRRPRHACPSDAGRAAERAVGRCATSPSRSPRRSARSTPTASNRAATMPPTLDGGRHRQRAARQPPVPPRRARRRLARGPRHVAPDGTFAEVLVRARSIPCRRSSRPVLRTAPARRCRTDAARWLAEARSTVGRGRVIVVDYARATTTEMALLPWRALAAHLPPPRARRRLPRRARASRTSPPTSPSTSSRSPTSSARRPSSSSASASTSSSRRGGRRGGRRRRAPTSAAMAMRSRVSEAEALLDPAGLGGFTVIEWECPVPPEVAD